MKQHSKIRSVVILLGFVIALVATPPRTASPASASSTLAGRTGWDTLSYAPAPVDNPLKGFVPFLERPHADVMPYSMEFFYLPLSSTLLYTDTYDWTEVETRLNTIAGHGNQAVLRFYLDYPNLPHGIPQYLIDAGLLVREGDFSSWGIGVVHSPDYNSPLLRGTLERFIAVLGERYDGDPRIGFLQLGLIGFWGEWHTWPADGWTMPESWMASDATQDQIMTAFDNAFDTTRLVVRYPTWISVNKNIGYHDDSFALNTLFRMDWYFMAKMQAAGATERWKEEAIGGELRPEIQQCIWLDDPVAACREPLSWSGGSEFPEPYAEAVTTTHASWLIADRIFTSTTVLTPTSLARAVEGSRQLGYELYAAAVKLPRGAASRSLPVSLKLRNTGVAPFYYDWTVQLGLLDRSNRLVASWDTPWALTSVIPGEPDTELSYAADIRGLRAGRYTLAMRVVNPLPQGRALRFANTSQDHDKAGWLSLGKVNIGGR